MAATCLLLYRAWRRSNCFRNPLRGIPIETSFHPGWSSLMIQELSSPGPKDRGLHEFTVGLNLRRRPRIMTVLPEAPLVLFRWEKRKFCFHPCPLQRRYIRAGLLSRVDDSQESVLGKSINRSALANEIGGLQNETQHALERRKVSTSELQRKASSNVIDSFSFAASKDNPENLQPAHETAPNASDVVTSHSSIEPLTLESLGFTGDRVEIEKPQKTSVDSYKCKGTPHARKQKKSSSEIDSAEDDASSDVVASKVIAEPVSASPQKMKQVALEASSILAEAAGIKTFFKKAATKQVSSTEDQVAPQFIKLREDEPNVAVNGVVENAPLNAEVDETAKLWSHPWPEWVAFLKFLHTSKFFEDFEQWADDGKSIFETYSLVRHATVGFGRYRNDIFRSLTRKDLKVIANFGCPDTERKASNASKRLRAHFDIFEGDVCVRCKFKMSCPRAFLKPPIKVPIGTLDVVRVLTGLAGNAAPDAEFYTQYPEEVKVSACKLLKEILVFGAMPRDPTFPEDAPTEPPAEKPYVEPPPTKRGAFTVPEKPGDWVCPNCEYMNFARNKVCLECRVSRPRQEQEIFLGDWECPKCRYLNFSKNVVCRDCKTKRPTKVQWTGGERLPENISTEKNKVRFSSEKPRNNVSWKPNLSRREVTMRRNGEQDYEASDEDVDNTDMDDSSEAQDIESEVDLSDEEEEALSRSLSNTMRGRVKNASTNRQQNNRSRAWSQSDTGLVGSKASPKLTGKWGHKAMTEASMPSRGKVGKFLVSDTESDSQSSVSDSESDSESWEYSRAEVQRGKLGVSKSRSTSKSNSRVAGSSVSESSEDETSTLPQSARTLGSKPLFHWSDSENEESDGQTNTHSSGKSKKKVQKMSKSERRAEGKATKTMIHHSQKSGSENEESDGQTNTHSGGKSKKKVQKMTERRAEGKATRTMIHHSQKSGSGGKILKGKR